MGKSQQNKGTNAWGMEKFYIVSMANGKSSGELLTVPDVASWIEDNMPPIIGKVTIKLHKRRSASFRLEELKSEWDHLQKRIELINERMAQVRSQATADSSEPQEGADEERPM